MKNFDMEFLCNIIVVWMLCGIFFLLKDNKIENIMVNFSFMLSWMCKLLGKLNI